MDLIAYARILRRRWWLLAAMVALGLLVAGYSWVRQKDDGSFYRATHTLVAAGADVNLDRAAAVATAGQVPERASTRLAGTTPGELAAQVRVAARRDVGFVEVTAFGTDPERTVEVADVVADELSAYVSQLEDAGRAGQIDTYERRIAELQSQIATLQLELDQTVDPVARAELEARLASQRTESQELQSQLDRLQDESLDTAVLETFTPAEAVPISGPQLRALFQTSGTSSGPDPSTAIAGAEPLGLVPRILLGGAFGLLVGVGAVLVLDRLDPRLRTKDDAERTFGWPVLSEVPPLSRAEQTQRAVLSASEPRSRTAEAYRVLRSSVSLALSGAATPDAPTDDGDDGATPPGKIVMVTSASPSEGKTTTVANLAAVFGEAGTRVLVVNCDFRRPALGAYLGVDPHNARVVPTDVPNVWLLAQVTDDPEHGNPAEVIRLQREVVTEARRRFDLVILDTAPLLTTNDANDVLAIADAIVVVARAGRTTREAADRCAETLDRRSAPVLGIVLVAAADAPAGRYYYYGDYYDADVPRGVSAPEHTAEVLVTDRAAGTKATGTEATGTTTPDPKAREAKAADVKAGDTKADSTTTGDTEAAGTKAAGTKATAADTTTTDTEATETGRSDARAPDHATGDRPAKGRAGGAPTADVAPVRSADDGPEPTRRP